MQTPNKGDSRWGSLFKNDLQGMLLPILLIIRILFKTYDILIFVYGGRCYIVSLRLPSVTEASHVAKNYDCYTNWDDLGSCDWCSH